MIVKRLYVELHRVKYNHVDESEIYEKTKVILGQLKELETILREDREVNYGSPKTKKPI
jgi:hypothetical protein